MTDWVIGVDVGGTFTDFSARNTASGDFHAHKRPSTPDDPSRAILDGLGEIRQSMLEASNVNVTEELVNMIEAQRVYEMNSKVISSVDKMMSFVNQQL